MSFNCFNTVNTLCNANISAVMSKFLINSALKTITIETTGKYNSYIVNRFLGSSTIPEYTSEPLTTNIFTDNNSNSALLDNTLYTYTITPTIQDIVGSAVYPQNGIGNGQIYTLANPSGINLVYNGVSSSVSSVAFDCSGNNPTNATLSVQDTNNNILITPSPSYTATTQTFSVVTFNGVSLTADTSYNINIYVVNGGGKGGGISACFVKQINTCTWASIGAITFDSIELTSVTLFATGRYTSSTVTVSPGTSTPISGSAFIYSTLTGGQNYTGLNRSNNITFTVTPKNMLGYSYSNSLTNSVQLKTPTVTTASFTSPTSSSGFQNTVSISVSGTFNGVVCKRYTGIAGTTLDSTSNFISATNSITITDNGQYGMVAPISNTLYTYTVTPCWDSASIVGTVFANITGGYTTNKSYGQIYTLAAPVSAVFILSPTAYTSVSFTITGLASTNSVIIKNITTNTSQNVILYSTIASDTYTYDSSAAPTNNETTLITNTIYNYTLTSVNNAGIGAGIAACIYTPLTTATSPTPITSATFCIPNVQNRIYNGTYSVRVNGGTYSKLVLTRQLADGSNYTYGSKQTGPDIIDDAKGYDTLTPNTQYNYQIILLDPLDNWRVAFYDISNQKAISLGKIYTLSSVLPATITNTGPLVVAINCNSGGYASITATTTTKGTGVLSGSKYTITISPTGYTGYNTALDATFTTKNTDNITTIDTINTYTPATFSGTPTLTLTDISHNSATATINVTPLTYFYKASIKIYTNSTYTIPASDYVITDVSKTQFKITNLPFSSVALTNTSTIFYVKIFPLNTALIDMSAINIKQTLTTISANTYFTTIPKVISGSSNYPTILIFENITSSKIIFGTLFDRSTTMYVFCLGGGGGGAGQFSLSSSTSTITNITPGGGGGGGGIAFASMKNYDSSYNLTIGAGGAGGIGSQNNIVTGTNGGNGSSSTLTQLNGTVIISSGSGLGAPCIYNTSSSSPNGGISAGSISAKATTILLTPERASVVGLPYSCYTYSATTSGALTANFGLVSTSGAGVLGDPTSCRPYNVGTNYYQTNTTLYPSGSEVTVGQPGLGIRPGSVNSKTELDNLLTECGTSYYDCSYGGGGAGGAAGTVTVSSAKTYTYTGFATFGINGGDGNNNGPGGDGKSRSGNGGGGGGGGGKRDSVGVNYKGGAGGSGILIIGFKGTLI